MEKDEKGIEKLNMYREKTPDCSYTFKARGKKVTVTSEV